MIRGGSSDQQERQVYYHASTCEKKDILKKRDPLLPTFYFSYTSSSTDWCSSANSDLTKEQTTFDEFKIQNFQKFSNSFLLSKNHVIM
jgi:hypothetical protein